MNGRNPHPAKPGKPGRAVNPCAARRSARRACPSSGRPASGSRPASRRTPRPRTRRGSAPGSRSSRARCRSARPPLPSCSCDHSPHSVDRSMVSTTCSPDRAIASSITRGSAEAGTTPMTSKSQSASSSPSRSVATAWNATTWPPGRSTRANSAKASSGCSTWTITSRHHTRSSVASATGRCVAVPRSNASREEMSGTRSRRAARARSRWRCTGSMPSTRKPKWVASRTAWAPSPHPTSTTRLSGRRSSSRTTCSSTDGSRGARLSSRRAEKAASSRG